MSDGVYQISAIVGNRGYLPTNLTEEANQLHVSQPVTVCVDGCEVVSGKKEESIGEKFKNTRINGEVQRELSNIIRGEIKDPRINPLTSVVAVEVAPDLKTCKAYISVLGDEESQAKTLAGLKSAEGFIRSKLAKTVNLRNTPEIRFVLDQSIEYGVKMSKMIDEVTKDIKSEDDTEE